MLGAGLQVFLPCHGRHRKPHAHRLRGKGSQVCSCRKTVGLQKQGVGNSKGLAAQVGRLTGKTNLEALQDGLQGQPWRQGGWEEAIAGGEVGVPSPGPVPSSSPSSLLQSPFDSAPTPPPWATSCTHCQLETEGGARRSLLIHAIDENVRRSSPCLNKPIPAANTGRSFGELRAATSGPASEQCSRGPGSWLLWTGLGMCSMGLTGSCGQVETAPLVCRL